MSEERAEELLPHSPSDFSLANVKESSLIIVTVGLRLSWTIPSSKLSVLLSPKPIKYPSNYDIFTSKNTYYTALYTQSSIKHKSHATGADILPKDIVTVFTINSPPPVCETSSKQIFFF